MSRPVRDSKKPPHRVHLDLVIHRPRRPLLGQAHPLLVRLAEVGRVTPKLARQPVAECLDDPVGVGPVVRLGEEQQQARPPLVVGRAGGVVAQCLRAVAYEGRRMAQPREEIFEDRTYFFLVEKAAQAQPGHEPGHRSPP
jgi:hypothetical protein